MGEDDFADNRDGLLRFTHRVMFNFSADLLLSSTGQWCGALGTEDSDELEGCQFTIGISYFKKVSGHYDCFEFARRELQKRQWRSPLGLAEILS